MHSVAPLPDTAKANGPKSALADARGPAGAAPDAGLVVGFHPVIRRRPQGTSRAVVG